MQVRLSDAARDINKNVWAPLAERGGCVAMGGDVLQSGFPGWVFFAVLGDEKAATQNLCKFLMTSTVWK